MTISRAIPLILLGLLAVASAPASAMTPEGEAAWHLGRAVDIWNTENLQGAVSHLEQIDTTRGSAFAEADRAAFLLAAGYLRLGDRENLGLVVDEGGDPRGSEWRRWVSYLGLLETGGQGVAIEDFADSELLAAARNLEDGLPLPAYEILEGRDDPASVYLRILAAETLGKDAHRDREKLAQSTPSTAMEADLVGEALLALAAEDLAEGNDPRQRLSEVPESSRYKARAHHLAALVALAQGDSVEAAESLATVIRDFPNYEERRMVLLESGALEGNAGNWNAALGHYEMAETDLTGEMEFLEGLNEPDGSQAAWEIWDSPENWQQEIRLDAGESRSAFDEAVVRALALQDENLPARPEKVSGGKDDPQAISALFDQPTENQWTQVRSLRRELASARVAAADQTWEIEQMAEDRNRRGGYLNLGLNKSSSSTATLNLAVSRLDTLLAKLDGALANLDSAKDRALLRFGHRCRSQASELRRNLIYLEAVEHFHIGGPGTEKATPAGVPSLANLVDAEEYLALAMESFLGTFDVRSEEIITRSHALVWRPRLEEQSPLLRETMAAELSRSRTAGLNIGLEIDVLANDPAWREAKIRHTALVARADSLDHAHLELKNVVASQVALRGMERLKAQREAVALHAAEASFWLAVETDGDEKENEDARGYRTAALERHQAFLGDFPSANARSEVRFRLADLHLMQARDDFRGRMADFLGENPSADDLHDRGLAPFLDTTPAVALYGSILAEDPDYAHREAVLFSLGMILADEGQENGEARLAELVEEYPASPYAQEAWLRLGDAGFDRKDLATCRHAYEKASRGSDPDLKAIALYKLGWARFEDDMFAEAADAFSSLMDHGVPDRSNRAPQDLTVEAQEYLVRSLVRAGGASAYSRHFSRHGDRDYMADVLFDMGRLDRRFSLYEEAVACDELWLERFGTNQRALAVAERLVDSHQRAENSDAALAALLAQAPRFVAGSDWREANPAGDWQSKGRVFAQDAYRTAATRYHQKARESGDEGDWNTALTHYETWLGYWPEDTAAPRLHYQAGETSARLDRHEDAIGHFTRAAEADTGDFVRDAAWQIVAVTDAWYEEAPSDSLARRLLEAGQIYLDENSADSRSADLRWRAGNVAYGHQWYNQAAQSFEDFESAHPGDKRAPDAARLAADAWYQHPDLLKAAPAYEHALELARAAGRDSVAVILEGTVPLVYFQYAESVAADSTASPESSASLFLDIARNWPEYANADLALYRAGLGFAFDEPTQAVAAWEELLEKYPGSDYDRDASLEVARIHESAGQKVKAAEAYERFSVRHPEDPDAPEALLMAIDLSANDPRSTRRRQDDFVARFPGQTEQVMVIRHGWALSALNGGAPGTDLDNYLAAAAVYPELADPRVLAEVDYRAAENAFADYEAIGLTQPLAASLEIKKARLEEVIGLYNRCVQRGVLEFSHASAHRIGAAIVHFGDALTASERPADLKGDDLFAYEEVIEEQGWSFYARGEEAWNQLLKQNRDRVEDPGAWIARTQDALWPRVAQRFMHQPEVEYPLVVAVAPQQVAEAPPVEP